jgi:hypothetical protein
MCLIERGASVTAASQNGMTRLYATINMQWHLLEALVRCEHRQRAARHELKEEHRAHAGDGGELGIPFDVHE